MELPIGMRAATLEKRKQFYEKFDRSKAHDWVGRPLVYAVVIGRHTNMSPGSKSYMTNSRRFTQTPGGSYKIITKKHVKNT